MGEDLFAAALDDSPVGERAACSGPAALGDGDVEIVEPVGGMPAALTSGADAFCGPIGRPQSHEEVPGGLNIDIDLEEEIDAAESPAWGEGVLTQGAPCARAARGATSGRLSAKAASKTGRKRQAPDTGSSQCPKRKVPAESSPTLNQIKDRALTIRCVYAPYQQTDQMVPIPLWPQYHASWRNESFPDTAFLVVSNYERWFTQLVGAVTKDITRTVAKNFFDHFRAELRASMGLARKPECLEDPLTDPVADGDGESGDEGATRKGRAGKTREALVNVDFAGHDLLCLNHLGQGHCRMVLKLDSAAERFLIEWLVPTVAQLARKAQSARLKPDAALTTAEDPEKTAGFQLGTSSTPNIRGKVTWTPSGKKWSLTIKEPTGEVAGLAAKCCVNPALKGQEYEEEKRAAYWRAVTAWNELDGSRRVRIPVREE